MSRDESYYANEAGVNKTMEAARPVSGAGDRGRIKQRQGKRAGCIEIGGKDTVCLLLGNNHRHGNGNVSAARQMADDMILTGRALLIVVIGRRGVVLGELCLMHMLVHGWRLV